MAAIKHMFCIIIPGLFKCRVNLPNLVNPQEVEAKHLRGIVSKCNKSDSIYILYIIILYH